MIDFNFALFGFTLLLLLVGVWYACTSANISGEDDVEDDGRGHAPKLSNVVRFARRDRTPKAAEPEPPSAQGPET